MKNNSVLKIFVAAVFIVFFTSMVSAQELLIETSVSTPWMLADRTNTAFVKISLTGFDIGERRTRTPVNVVIVLDRSGSMDGEKIIRAREAAKMAIQLLEPRDIASIVTYSDTVSVLVPATRVTDKEFIFDRIDRLFAGGSTALFAGVSKGADELLKFFDTNMVNRVILFSDGLANVGPDSPEALGDLGDLGASLRKTGVSVTTVGLGLGYNEDLMVQLTEKSEEALRLRDEGLIEKAKAAVQANSLYLQSNAATLGSEDLAGYGEMMAAEAESIESEEEWAAARKRMVEDQYEKASQQSY